MLAYIFRDFILTILVVLEGNVTADTYQYFPLSISALFFSPSSRSSSRRADRGRVFLEWQAFLQQINKSSSVNNAAAAAAAAPRCLKFGGNRCQEVAVLHRCVPTPEAAAAPSRLRRIHVTA